jgi:hypothetical protein
METYSIFLLYKKESKLCYLLFIFLLFTTGFEYLMLILKKGIYGHCWNLFWTFVSLILKGNGLKPCEYDIITIS